MEDRLTLFMCGDVMSGRGIDQILPRPSNATLHEPYSVDARDYVRLAEDLSGQLPLPVGFDYVWGDALAEMTRPEVAARVINLETSVTTSDAHWPDKRIHYRMHPANALCLTAARIDCCALSNNHVMDWGTAGLLETLETLDKIGVRHAGAGRTLLEAASPAILDLGRSGRLLVLSIGSWTGGIPSEWAAEENRPGVSLLEAFPDPVGEVRERLLEVRRPGDVALLSVHWGENWGYRIPSAQRDLAHRWVDEAGVDIVHGHSSHHVKGIEVHKERLILYGCGDFLNDYEGISGHRQYRPDLSLLYFVDVAPSTGRLLGLRMTTARLQRFRVHRTSEADTRWLQDLIDREGRDLGTRAEPDGDGHLGLRWTETSLVPSTREDQRP